MLPVLTLKYVADGNQLTGHVLLRNIGRGHAFNISSLTYMSFFSDRGYRYSKLTLDAVPNDLKRDEELTMTAWVYEAGKVVKDRTIGGVMTMLTVDGGERRKVPIFYTDVAGNRYVTYLETGARRVRIIQPSRRFGVKERCRYGLYRVRESLTFFYYSMRRAHYGFSNRE
ncbi:hypothetical protein PV726_37750 [Streptomyces europaeiscabiei]|uniref:hypothetical protein n=1 Tax=Streptomyces europaeiscabiei TaxID=146819 RepID=UPI0029B7F579|nr:hypothetical protein [Streptomyces europaeiscabiei]MDX3695964.1 hypothetical protein [Streptomyces europaeiscabiei]